MTFLLTLCALKCADAPQLMKVSAILRGSKDDLGRQNVVIRISEGQRRGYKFIGIKLKPEEFNSGLVRSTHPLQRAYNLKIKEEILKAEKQGGFEEKENGLPFYDYSLQLIDRWEKSKRPETLRQYRAELSKFSRFDDGAVLSDFTPAYLQKYKEHCFSIGNSENTTWKTFKFIRTVILRAEKEGLIDSNPFSLFEMPKYRDPQKVWLTEDEVQKIDKQREKSLPEQIHFAATWFLIGVYSGLRFGDMQAFQKSQHIKQGRLIMYTSKTGEVISIPLSSKLKELFEDVKYKGVYFSNAHYNRLLKEVGKLAKIKTVLTAHVSRHSAAVRWANHGVSQEVVAKLLGHQNLKTTAIYFKITNKRIDSELPD